VWKIRNELPALPSLWLLGGTLECAMAAAAKALDSGLGVTRSSFSASMPTISTPSRLHGAAHTPGVSAVYSPSVGTAATASLNVQDELRSLRAQNEVRQRAARGAHRAVRARRALSTG
jgi:hypothetical protein